MDLLAIFRKPQPITDPILGNIDYIDGDWICVCKVNNVDVEISIAGNKSGIDNFAKEQLIRLLPLISLLWINAQNFALSKLLNTCTPFTVSKHDFVLQSISIHQKESFDGGHLAMWFDLACDNEGTYYVSFIDEQPSYLHRDT